MRCSRVYFLVSVLAASLQCGRAVREEAAAAYVPPADRESWDFRLELRQPGLRVEIAAPYVRDFAAAQVTRADSGVELSFYAAAGRVSCRIRAQRLTLERKSAHLGLGGRVELSAGDSLAVEADTLVWVRGEDSLWVPGRVWLRSREGRESGRNLRAPVDFSHWSIEAPRGSWRGAGEGGAYEVELEALRASSRRRGGGLVADYDSATVRYEGARIYSRRVHFDGPGGVLRFVEGAESVDSLRSLRAGEMEYDLKNRRLRARGTVELQEPELELRASRLEEDGEGWRAWGEPLLVRRAKRTLEALEAQYDEQGDALDLSGQVHFRAEGRELEARRARYLHGAERLEAAGEVRLDMPQFEGLATAAELVYDLAAAEVEFSGAPVFSRRRAGAEILVMRADSLRLDLRRQILEGRAHFILEATGLRLRAGRGHYAHGAERLELGGRVALEQQEGERAATAQVQADSMVVRLRAGRLEQVEVPAALEGSIETPGGQVNWLRAGRGVFFFAGAHLERALLEGEAELTQQELDDKIVNRFKGDSLSLHFAAGGEGLARLEVEGRAELWSSTREGEGDDTSINRVQGARLEIFFGAGQIDSARVSESIQGRFYAPKKEGP